MNVYLGDGVYLSFDGWAWELYTSNGVNVTNRIVLEPDVMRSLRDVVARVMTKASESA